MALLEIKNLTKEYKESEGVLNNISLSVEKGEVLVILGPSGCGKSTLLRCINGLERIQSGEIYLDGKLISNQTKEMHKVREKIGMVFQSYDLFPNMTVLKNILLGPLKVQKRNVREATEQAENLLSRIGLLDKKNSYPAELSGGQKQRVAIARALCMNPDVLLFDEVTASLDPEMVREVLDVIMQLAKDGKTMLIVTHQLEFARAVADRIIFIDQGRILEDSKPEKFFTGSENQRVNEFLQAFKFEKKSS
jgi:polar amino acid transport system ATP-binding protein